MILANQGFFVVTTPKINGFGQTHSDDITINEIRISFFKYKDNLQI